MLAVLLFFLSENFQFLVVKFSIHLHRHVFVMIMRIYRISFDNSHTTV